MFTTRFLKAVILQTIEGYLGKLLLVLNNNASSLFLVTPCSYGNIVYCSNTIFTIFIHFDDVFFRMVEFPEGTLTLHLFYFKKSGKRCDRF